MRLLRTSAMWKAAFNSPLIVLLILRWRPGAGEPGLALVQSMPGRFQAKLGGDACQQRVVVLVALQQRAQRHAELAEQAQPQVAPGGHPQAVAALAEVTRIRGNDADAAAMVGVAELARRAGIARGRSCQPAANSCSITRSARRWWRWK